MKLSDIFDSFKHFYWGIYYKYPLCCVLNYCWDICFDVDKISVERGCFDLCHAGYVHCEICHKKIIKRRLKSGKQKVR